MGAHRALSRDIAQGVKTLVYTGENGKDPISLHRMPSLRYLAVQNTKVVGNIGKLAPNLLWVKIKNCELSDTYTCLTLRNRFQLDRNWSQVKILSVEKCASLTRIPKTLDRLVNLQCLYLQDCVALTTLPNTLDRLVNLQCLYLQDCVALTTLPNTLGNLSQLKRLCLRRCTSLTSLPDTVGNLMQLKWLELAKCTNLRSLPSTVGNLAQLRWLSLTGCIGLRNLPNAIGDLAQLRLLFTDCWSRLQNLPYAVGKLQNLRILWLPVCFPDRTDVESFHDGVVKLAQLRELNRSAGLMQKKFNVCFLCHTADAGETLMEYKCKYLQRSLRIYTGNENDESCDIREAIDSSDILVPILSKSFVESISCVRKCTAMLDSNNLLIYLYLPTFWSYHTEFHNTLRDLEYQSS